MIAWGHFYIILLHYPLCHKGDIIYRYVSLHHSLEIWVFLTLGKLTRSIFIENSMKSIIYGPSLQATWKPHQKMPNMVLMFLLPNWMFAMCGIYPCLSPWSSFSFGMHLFLHQYSFLCFTFHLCAYHCLCCLCKPKGYAISCYSYFLSD